MLILNIRTHYGESKNSCYGVEAEFTGNSTVLLFWGRVGLVYLRVLSGLLAWLVFDWGLWFIQWHGKQQNTKFTSLQWGTVLCFKWGILQCTGNHILCNLVNLSDEKNGNYQPEKMLKGMISQRFLGVTWTKQLEGHWPCSNPSLTDE